MDSLAAKVSKKGYKNPQKEIHDLSGIRVITFIQTDTDRACNVIRKSFHVHEAESLDKTAELGLDRIGYRSMHFICDLGRQRERLPEFASFKGLLFEIQVRTVLQHAWAEIEHDRSYKFAGVLPADIQRRLYLVAGLLETVDREFDFLAKSIDTYSAEVSKKTKGGDLDIDLNTPSLKLYLKAKIPEFKGMSIEPVLNAETVVEVTQELRDFGIQTLQQLDDLLNDKEFLKALKRFPDFSTDIGLLRDAMLYADVEKYFADCWKQNWEGTDKSFRDFLASKYGMAKIKELIDKYSVENVGDDEDDAAVRLRQVR